MEHEPSSSDCRKAVAHRLSLAVVRVIQQALSDLAQESSRSAHEHNTSESASKNRAIDWGVQGNFRSRHSF